MTITDTILRGIARRKSTRPNTSSALPHVQLDQWPAKALMDELLQACLAWDGVRIRESRMASVDSAALWIEDEYGNGPDDAYIDDHEFCHICYGPNGFIHLTLPDSVRGPLIDAGWSERHPAAQAGMISPTIVMVYAPRDQEELAVVTALVHFSYLFAAGHAPK